MSLTRRQTLALAAATFAAPAFAQRYPDKPVKLIVNFPPGGAADVIGRALAQALSDSMKQQVVVENRPGANGNLGADAVAKSAPDGYALVLVDVFHSSAPIYTRKMPYDAVKDFTPVALIGRSPAFLVAGPGLDAKGARDVLAFARANPGKLSMAIAGTGSVVVDLFRARSGVQFLSVPYKGSSPALVDLMSGQVQVMITTMASAGAHVKSGKLRALAVTGARRHPEHPDVPTFAEVGVAGMDYEQWFGLLGPAGMPAPVVAKLASAVEQVMKMPDVRERLATLALDLADPGAEVMRRQLEADAARWRKLAAELDIKPLD